MQEITHAIVICCLAVFVGATVFGLTIKVTVPTTSFIEGFR